VTRGSRAAGASTLITPARLRAWPLPRLDGALGKEARGRIMVVGGSEQIPGAAMLAALAALRAGAGTLQIATTRGVAPAVGIAVPEARVIGLAHGRDGELAAAGWRRLARPLADCDAVVAGVGMVSPAAAVGLVRHLLRDPKHPGLVVDAAALAAFRGRRRPIAHPGAGVILTPHAGEMAKLAGVDRDAVLADPLATARAAAAALGVIVVLKGACTYVAGPDGAAMHNTTGNLGLGTSGSGDTLAGVIGGLLARGAAPMQAAAWGVYLHGRAGEVLARRVGPLGYLARELLAEVPSLLAGLTRR
jgi:hydroxyethylthiazole kinase-like uncharacterized protein yjeF